MDVKDEDYLDALELRMAKDVLKYCQQEKILGTQLLENDDLNTLWNNNAAEYLADAVKEIAGYPLVSIAWASYLGIAAAQAWDKDWHKYQALTSIFYTSMRDKRGFDNFDEHVAESVLHISINSEEYLALRSHLMNIAQIIIDHIKHEQVEPSSIMAYRIFARATRIAYKFGVAIQLFHLGYKLQKINLN